MDPNLTNSQGVPLGSIPQGTEAHQENMSEVSQTVVSTSIGTVTNDTKEKPVLPEEKKEDIEEIAHNNLDEVGKGAERVGNKLDNIEAKDRLEEKSEPVKPKRVPISLADEVNINPKQVEGAKKEEVQKERGLLRTTSRVFTSTVNATVMRPARAVNEGMDQIQTDKEQLLKPLVNRKDTLISNASKEISDRFKEGGDKADINKDVLVIYSKYEPELQALSKDASRPEISKNLYKLNSEYNNKIYLLSVVGKSSKSEEIRSHFQSDKEVMSNTTDELEAFSAENLYNKIIEHSASKASNNKKEVSQEEVKIAMGPLDASNQHQINSLKSKIDILTVQSEKIIEKLNDDASNLTNTMAQEILAFKSTGNDEAKKQQLKPLIKDNIRTLDEFTKIQGREINTLLKCSNTLDEMTAELAELEGAGSSEKGVKRENEKAEISKQISNLSARSLHQSVIDEIKNLSEISEIDSGPLCNILDEIWPMESKTNINLNWIPKLMPSSQAERELNLDMEARESNNRGINPRESLEAQIQSNRFRNNNNSNSQIYSASSKSSISLETAGDKMLKNAGKIDGEDGEFALKSKAGSKRSGWASNKKVSSIFSNNISNNKIEVKEDKVETNKLDKIDQKILDFKNDLPPMISKQDVSNQFSNIQSRTGKTSDSGDIFRYVDNNRVQMNVSGRNAFEGLTSQDDDRIDFHNKFKCILNSFIGPATYNYENKQDKDITELQDSINDFLDKITDENVDIQVALETQLDEWAGRKSEIDTSPAKQNLCRLLHSMNQAFDTIIAQSTTNPLVMDYGDNKKQASSPNKILDVGKGFKLKEKFDLSKIEINIEGNQVDVKHSFHFAAQTKGQDIPGLNVNQNILLRADLKNLENSWDFDLKYQVNAQGKNSTADKLTKIYNAAGFETTKNVVSK